MIRVVLAPDKFKGSLTAPEVARGLAEGIARVRPDAEIVRVPVADGGDGTVDAFVAAGWERVAVDAPGPTGVVDKALYAMRGDTAVVELAAVVGSAKLPAGVFDPLGSSTYGLGVVIADALDRGARHIVLGLGGSASTDGGAGMLVALGARVLDAVGRELPRGGAALVEAAELHTAGLHSGLASARITLACDVDNPLLGPHGAVAVYAEQKGADRDQRAILEAALANWASVAGSSYVDSPGAGAAGGTGFGAMTVLGAQPRSGIDIVLDLLEFGSTLDGATLVVTGEGSLDEQSLHGKAPIGVCAAARTAGVPVVAAVGRALLAPDRIHAAGFTACHTLTDLEPDPARCIAGAAELVVFLGDSIARTHLPTP
ncbi:glycerate kinase [Nocardia bovistercoris]|uniref:Glycerate kinase n=1 Tax=Nocardia bovistercoris TaxID=2785916 RepID=A0A931ICN2_9NOCA|nr:glycerate kinase [Nocardia bovistercoris]MBH0778676.1 glycerate kinase [Nocardia bovistercoris]